MVDLIVKKITKNNFIIQPSPINGQGLFANRDYAPNEEIMRFVGNPIEMVWLNHSCEPSAYTYEPDPKEYQTHILYAGKNGIKKEEEITYDYRLGQDLSYWIQTVKGKCNCPKCKNEKINS